MYDISRHKRDQREVRKELLSLAHPIVYPQPLGAFKYPSLGYFDLPPLLNAVIKISLRLRGKAPNANPRVTPDN